MILPLIRHDFTIQYRSGFYAAYAFVCVSYIALLRVIPPEARALALPPVLLSEASVVGFFFAGALLHFERIDGVLRALAVTPIRTSDYVSARVASLTTLNVAVALIITVGGAGRGYDVPILAAAAVLTGTLFSLLGIAVSCRFRRIDHFVVLGGLVSALLGLPVFPYFGLLESPLWRVLPTDAALRLLGHGTGALSLTAAAAFAAAGILAAWCAASALLARRWLDRYATGRSS